MKYTLNLNDNRIYAEMSQHNPLRWKTLFRENESTFSDQSGWIKCKDFYNDTVAYFKAGSVFSIYEYKNAVKKNKEGVYFLLKNVVNKELFTHNIGVMNKQLEKDLDCIVDILDLKEDKDKLIILIPNELWDSTYRISMVTMVVRLCNYGNKYQEWEDFWKQGSPALTVEHAFTTNALENARKLGFLVPKKFTKYWYFAGSDYNSEKNPKITGGIIHNNGVSNWSMYMKGI